jgi:putative ABC transport system permease protein
MKIPIVAGREFNDQDQESSLGVVVVNQAFVRTFFPNEEVMGKRIHVAGSTCEIVGITRDVKIYGLEEKIPAEVYQPYRQKCSGYLSVVARTVSNPEAVTAALRKTVLDIDKDQPIHNVRTFEELVAGSTAGRRFMMILMGTFATVALLLCAIGIYGLISYIVAQRTHEFGIRMALGAGVNDVLCLVLRQGLRPALAGMVLGSVGAWITTRLLQSQLYGVEAHDPATFALGVFVLSTIALAACFIPARRATRINPMTALRCE